MSYSRFENNMQLNVQNVALSVFKSELCSLRNTRVLGLHTLHFKS